jgi:hypothetical protein
VGIVYRITCVSLTLLHLLPLSQLWALKYTE